MQRRGHPQRSSLWIYRVDPYEIHYLKFILEAHEGLATLTTLDPKEGLIQLAVPPGCDSSLEVLMEALCQELGLERISPKCKSYPTPAVS